MKHLDQRTTRQLKRKMHHSKVARLIILDRSWRRYERHYWRAFRVHGYKVKPLLTKRQFHHHHATGEEGESKGMVGGVTYSNTIQR